MTFQSKPGTGVQQTLARMLAERPRDMRQDVDASVVAVIAVEEDRRYFARTIGAVLAQSVLPGTIVVADCTGKTEQSVYSSIEAILPRSTRLGYADAVSAAQVQVVPARGAASFGDAVGKALDQAHLPQSAECLWLLHDDSRPVGDTCLETLLEAHRNVPTASVIGVKQLDWQGKALHDVGSYAASGHRVVSLVVDGEPDQEQYDGRQDVFAVSLAGALVPMSTWRSLGGVTRWMTTFGESKDFCRRACLSGGRVLVVPQAAVAHRRARFEGIRTRSGAPIGENDAGNSALARITAAWRYRITDVSMATWPLQWLGLLLRGFIMFFVLLFNKKPYEGACELAMPWRALINMPKAAGARMRVRRQSSTTLGQLGVLVANRTQLARWKERRRAFASQQSVVLLSTLAKAHLRRRWRIRFAWASVMTLIMAAAVIALRRNDIGQLISGAHLASDRLLGTGATFGQLWQAATTPYTYGFGMGAPASPSPFLLVLGAASAVTAGHVNAAVTLIYLLAAPLSALSFWALAGIFTRSNPVRAASGLMWGTLAAAMGLYQSGDLPMLTVMTFLPAAFAFTHRAVAMYLTEDPVRPVPSVQSAALASLCFIPVVDAEPQLLLPLVAIFVAFLLLVRRHRLMLLLIPVPAAFSLAPTLVNAVRYFHAGAWRQLFGDALMPSSSANGAPRALSLADVVAAAFGHDAATLGWSGWLRSAGVTGTLMAVSAGVLLVVAVLALAMPMALRVSRMMWAAAIGGALLAMASPRVLIGVDASGQVAGSVLPGFALCMMGLLACGCMVAGSGVQQFRPLDDRRAARTMRVRSAHGGAIADAEQRRARMWRVALSCAMACCVALWGGFGAMRTADANGAVAASSGSLPMVAVDYLGQDASHRVLAVRAQSSVAVDVTVMRTARGELIDASAASGMLAASGQHDEASASIAQAVSRLLSNSDSQAIAQLSDLGIGGIFVATDAGAGDDASYDALVSNITASEGVQNVVAGTSGTYFRIALRDVASQGIDMAPQTQAQGNPWRRGWLWSFGALVVLYCLVALPSTRFREQEQA